MHVTFSSGPLTLEGELMSVDGAPRGAVICHPHPAYGGDMDNPVVLAVAGALHDTGHTTLRFNFRGVGASGGSYGGGVGEVDDLRAAVQFLVQRTGNGSITLAGYSFGAVIVLHVGPSAPQVDRLVVVAPPLAIAGLEALASCTKDKLFIVGDQDEYCSLAQLSAQLARVAEPKHHKVIAGADHFFAGHTPAVAECVRSVCASL